jgi:hypothetical protein
MANLQEKLNTNLDEDQKFAVELLAWANSHNISDDSFIATVAKDINDKQNYSFWAQQNALELLPSAEIPAGQKFIRVSRLFATLRNVLIFLPVALTWAAVGNATSAFGQFIELNGTTTVNFLDFWQNGYDLLDPFWRISSVSEKVFLIILFVIALTLFSSSLFSYGRELNNKANIAFERERTKIGLRLNKYFYDRKITSSENISSDVIKAIVSLNEASKNILGTATTINKVLSALAVLENKTETLHKNIDLITKVGKSDLEKTLENFTFSMKGSSEKMGLASTHLIELLEKINDFVKLDLTKTIYDSKNHIESANKEIINSSVAVSSDAERLQSEIRLLHTKISSIVSKLK